MRCAACEAYSRALFSGDEALVEAARALADVEDCQCPEVIAPQTNAGDIERIARAIAGGAVIEKLGDCGHRVSCLEHEAWATCRVCWRRVPVTVAVATETARAA